MRLDPLRIHNPWLKALAIVGVFFLRYLVFAVLLADVAPAAMALVDVAVGLVLIYGLTRVFRVREEPIVPARAWWRATGRPTAGFVIAAFLVVSTVAGFVASPVDGSMGDIGYLVFSVAWTGLVAGFYVNSSIRLRRAPRDSTALPGRMSDW